MAKLQFRLKGPTWTWSKLRKQWVYFQTMCPYNLKKYCILFPRHMNIHFLKCISNVTILPTMCSWHTHGFHVLISSWRLFSDSHFYWLLSVGSVLSVCHMSIKWFIMKMSYLLPRAKFLPGTLFMNRSYLLPRENFKLPYLPSEARQHMYSIEI